MVLILATNSFATKDVAFIYLYSKKKLVAPTKPSVFVYKGLGGRATRHLCYFPEYIFIYIKDCIWPAFHFHWITMGEKMKAKDLSRSEQNLWFVVSFSRLHWRKLQRKEVKSKCWTEKNFEWLIEAKRRSDMKTLLEMMMAIQKLFPLCLIQ